MLLKSIYIKNFRSIDEQLFDCNNLNIFVGRNDEGKSNILRALNLFFNGKTDHDVDYRFNRDFCNYAKPKKTKEILVEIKLDPPSSYASKGEILWTKQWKWDGTFSEDINHVNGSKLFPGSRLPSLLRAIQFHYVPAIKGADYFSKLLGDLHDMLAETVETEMRKASSQFTESINRHTASILASVKEKLGIVSSIELPANLRDLFSTLDFQSDAASGGMSLNQRGDGIKVRHIPIILNWLSEQANFNRTKGSIPIHTIWGYEEPENNLELSSALELATEFSRYSVNVQMFVTTHSPAFYSLGLSSSPGVSLFRVSKQSGSNRTSIKNFDESTSNDLHKEMGLLPFLAPYIDRAKADREEFNNSIATAARYGRPTVFVEGPTDKKILDKAFTVLFPGETCAYAIETDSEDGAGHDWVRDQIIAWATARKKEKAFGLFDGDSVGKAARKEANSNNCVQRYQHIATDELTFPKHLRAISKKHIKIPNRLEELFPPTVWQHAMTSGWLVPRSNISEIKYDQHNITFRKHCEDCNLTQEEMLYATHEVDKNKKNQFANYVCGLSAAESNDAFAELKPLLEKLMAFF